MDTASVSLRKTGGRVAPPPVSKSIPVLEVELEPIFRHARATISCTRPKYEVVLRARRRTPPAGEALGQRAVARRGGCLPGVRIGHVVDFAMNDARRLPWSVNRLSARRESRFGSLPDRCRAFPSARARTPGTAAP